MKFRHALYVFLLTFAVAFVANLAIVLLWNFFIKHEGWVIDWETSFRFPLLFAIIMLFTRKWNK